MKRRIKMSKKVDKILKGIVKDSKDLQLLKKNPEELAKKYNLTKNDLLSLESADLLITRKPKNPLADVTTITFTTGMTITGNIGDLDKNQLITVLERVLVDDDYAKKVKDYFIKKPK